MPLYSFRLDAQDGSGHHRRGTIDAATLEEARAFLLGREHRTTAFRLTPDVLPDLCAPYPGVEPVVDGGVTDVEATVAQFPIPGVHGAGEEARAPFRNLQGRHRALLSAHRQAEPYRLTMLEPIDPQED